MLRKALRNRVVRIGLGFGMAAVGVTSVGMAWAIEAAKPTTCMALEKADLSLQEIVAVKRQVDAHDGEDTTTALRLSGREATFILAEHFEYPVWVSVHDDEVEARLALPDNGHCYNIEFQGQVHVDHGVASVVPSHLLIGRLDLSTLFGGKRIELGATTIKAESVAGLLTKTQQLTVEEDRIVVELDDVAGLQ